MNAPKKKDDYILVTAIKCKFCGKITPVRDAHKHLDGFVCEDCWDDRLRTTA